MSFIEKLEPSFTTEASERQLDASDQWVTKIELPDDSGNWQDSLDIPEDIVPQSASFENQERDLSRFEESRQVKQMVTYLRNMPEVKLGNWINLSFEERVKAVQKIETQAAEVGCRPALAVKPEHMKEDTYGYIDWSSQKIVINEKLLRSNRYGDFQQCIKTLLHEGRHAYQYSNITLERTEPNDEKYQSWKLNLTTGYYVAKRFGFKNYYLQPIEVDARVFSEAIVSRVMK